MRVVPRAGHHVPCASRWGSHDIEHHSRRTLSNSWVTQFALDEAEDAALLAGDEDAARIGRIVAAISLVDIGALDLTSGEPFGGFDDGAERVAIVGVSRQRLGVQHELTARGAGVGGDDRGLDAELVGGAGLAFADALDLGSVEGIELPAALALLLGADLIGARERPLEHGLKISLAADVAANVTDDPAKPGAQQAQLPAVTVELLGMGIAPRHHRRALGDAQI